MAKRTAITIAGERIRRGESRDIRLKVSESYTGDPIAIPLRVIRAKKPGTVVYICGAVHGDEINGTGIIRQLMFSDHLDLASGTLILIPVVNGFGFEAHSRYLPDRRDLNRCFPGSQRGSLASRVAEIFFREIVMQSDYGIDLHTAALRRTNYPNIRADMTNPAVRRIARSFGCEMIINSKGPVGSLRREACRADCPTIVLEAGGVWKIEPYVVDVGVRGVCNVLIDLDMLKGEPHRPIFQTRVEKTTWVRAELGGILTFHVAPGELVEYNQPIATNVSVIGDAQSIIISPADGILLGMTTLPAVKPGEPVCNIAVPNKRLLLIRKAYEQAGRDKFTKRLREGMARDITILPADAHDEHWPEYDS